MLKGIVIKAAISLGWDAALSFLAWLLRRGYVSFEVKVAEGHPLWKTGAEILKDGKITKGELITFLQEVDNHIPGVIDDIVINIIVVALGYASDFRWDQSDKVELFAAVSKMMEDGVFNNVEAADVVDSINAVTGLLRN